MRPMAAGGPFTEEFLRRVELLRLAVRRLGTVRVEGEQVSRRKGGGAEIWGYRPYAQGDDVRRVDWSAYARLEQLFVREFAREEAVGLEILLDASSSMRWGRPPKLALAQQLAATLGYLGLHNHAFVRVHWPGAAGAAGRAFQGPSASVALLRVLAETPPAVLRVDLPAALEEVAARSGDRRPFLVILSDFWVLGIGPALRRAAARAGRVAAVHVLAPEELEPSLRGKVRLVDCETGEEKDLYLNAEALREYGDELQRHLAALEAACREAEVGYVRLCSDMPLERAFFATVRRSGLVH